MFLSSAASERVWSSAPGALPGELELLGGARGVLRDERVVELEALVGHAHRVGDAVVELAADALPLGRLGPRRQLAGAQPIALALQLAAPGGFLADLQEAARPSVRVGQVPVRALDENSGAVLAQVPPHVGG
jgi:hypothetical protein